MPSKKYLGGHFIMTKEELNMIQEIVGGYKFKNLDLLQQAFVRKSYSKENGGENNEVLEFIGDKVLDFIIVKRLTSLDESGYGWMRESDNFDSHNDCNEYCCEYNEQKLTEIKKKLVCKEMLSKCISELALQNYLIMGKGDIEQGLDENDSVKEDLFEAILGAIALDSNYDISVLEQAVDVMLDPNRRIESEILGNEIDYINTIKQWHTKENEGLLPKLVYGDAQLSLWNSLIQSERIIQSTRNHYNDKFMCVLSMIINGNEVKFKGFGQSKSKAREEACILAYNYLKSNDLLQTIYDEIDNPNRNDAIGQLEILARRGYFSLPIYNFEQSYDKQGNPIWTAECFIEDEEYYFDATSSSKKEAKKTVAWEMLKYVLEIEDE